MSGPCNLGFEIRDCKEPVTETSKPNIRLRMMDNTAQRTDLAEYARLKTLPLPRAPHSGRSPRKQEHRYYRTSAAEQASGFSGAEWEESGFGHVSLFFASPFHKKYGRMAFFFTLNLPWGSRRKHHCSYGNSGGFECSPTRCKGHMRTPPEQAPRASLHGKAAAYSVTKGNDIQALHISSQSLTQAGSSQCALRRSWSASRDLLMAGRFSAAQNCWKPKQAYDTIWEFPKIRVPNTDRALILRTPTRKAPDL